MARAYTQETMPEKNAVANSGFYGNREETSGIERLIRVLLIIACVGAVLVLIWLMGVTPFMPFSRVIVSPIEGLTREEIFMYSGIFPASSFITTDGRAAERALNALPQIERAQVYKHFPDRLEIVIEGRKAVALAFAKAGNKTVPVIFDASGVIFCIGSIPAAMDTHALTVISGLVIEEPFLGMRMPPDLIPLLTEMETLKLRSPELLSAISEININQKETGGYDLIVCPMHPKLRVRIPELNEDVLKYTLLMADVLALREPGVSFVDFRSGVASYRLGDI